MVASCIKRQEYRFISLIYVHSTKNFVAPTPNRTEQSFPSYFANTKACHVQGMEEVVILAGRVFSFWLPWNLEYTCFYEVVNISEVSLSHLLHQRNTCLLIEK